MKITYLLLLSLLTLKVSGQSKPISIIPFKLEGNCLYIYVKVNEKDSVKFLFDTGANGSVINSQSVKKLGLNINGKSQNQGSNGTNMVDQSVDNKVTFGTIERKKVDFTLIPYDTDAFDGVFGTDLMKGHIVEIDYNKNELRFFKEDDKEIDYSSYDKVKLHLIDDYPAVEASFTVNGLKYSGLFGLDSGADDILTIASPFVRKNDLVKKMKKIGAASFQGSDGSTYEMPIVLCPTIEFSAKFIYNIPVSLSAAAEGIDATDKMTGFYGNSFLKRFNTIIDFKNELIYFKLNRNLYTSFD